MTVLGAGAAETTLGAGGDGSAITIDRGAFITIDGFTITGGDATFGGGVVNRGFLTTQDCTISGNAAKPALGGGGGIYNDHGHLMLQLTQISNNTSLAGQGGGILNAGGTVLLQGATQVTGNKAQEGGGIFNESGGTVTIDASSAVTGNTPDNCVGTTACGA